MRFYEHESKALFARHKLPLGGSGLARTAEEAKQIAAEIGGAVVLKSQVLSGGRMKAGAVKFADTPDEAAVLFDEILPIVVNGQTAESVLVEEKSPISQEYYVGVTWDGRRKLPVLIFSDMGGIDIEEVAETHPDHVSKTHFSTIFPVTARVAKEGIGATGVSGSDLNRLTPIVNELIQIFLQYDLTLAEINPLVRLEDGRFVILDGHVDMEAEARDIHKNLLAELGIKPEETRQARPPTEFEIKGAQVDASDHRGVAGNVVGFDGNLGLVIGAGGGSLTLFDAEGLRTHQAGALETGRREDRRDDERRLQHPRRHRGARGDQGLRRVGARPRRHHRHLPNPRCLGGRRLQDPEEARRRILRPQRLDVRGRRPRRRQAGKRLMSILINADTSFIVQGITGREAVSLTRENLDYGAKIVGGVTPGRAGRDVYGVPVYDCVRDITAKTRVDGAVVCVPPRFTRDAVFESLENGIKLIVIVTERIPRREVAQMVELAALRGARIIGPNCLGLISPGEAKMGGIGGPAANTRTAYSKGTVGVMSRSGGMTTEIANTLTAAGLGQSTAVSIGGDAIIGTSYAELMPLFEADLDTEAIAIYSEPGGRMEAELADWVRENDSRLPIVAFMAGRFMDDMPGMRFGHAGTIVEGKADTTADKIERMRAAGISVAERIEEIPALIKERLEGPAGPGNGQGAG